MESLGQLAAWVSSHESLLSGLAAMVALVAIVPAVLSPLLRRRRAERSARGEAKGPKKKSRSVAATPEARLAVFPIAAPGGSPDVQMAAEILGEDLTTLLARSAGCEVISSRSASAFLEGGGTLAEAGSALDVRYVIEGSIRPESQGFRVSASLVDADADRVVWSDTFETDSQESAEPAHRLAERVAAHLGIEVTRAEITRSRAHPRNKAASDQLLRAQGILFDKGHNRDSYRQAIELIEAAIATDPNDPRAHGLLALLMALGSVFGFVDTNAVSERVMEICRRALRLDDRSSEVLGYVGCAYCDLRQYEQGVPLLERAIEANPSNAQAKAAYGTAMVGLKRYDEGIEFLEEALRLTPAYKGIAPWATVLAGAYLRKGQLDEVKTSLGRALRCDATFFPSHLVAALVALGRSDRETAQRHMREARRTQPDLDEKTITSIMGRDAAALIAQIDTPDAPD